MIGYAGPLRGVARTAVVAGTATAVSNRVSRRQGSRWAEQEQQQAYDQPQADAGPPARRQQACATQGIGGPESFGCPDGGRVPGPEGEDTRRVGRGRSLGWLRLPALSFGPEHGLYAVLALNPEIP